MIENRNVELHLDDSELNLHNTFGSVLIDGNKKYMYLPYWIEVDISEDDDENFGLHKCKIHRLNDIPEHLEKLIKKINEV